MRITISGIDIPVQYHNRQLFSITYSINTDTIAYINMINLDLLYTQLVGQHLLVYDNDDIVIFGGDISSYKHYNAGRDREYKLICRGWENVINRKIVRKLYQATTLPAIIQDIFSKFVYDGSDYTLVIGNTGDIQRVVFETKVLDTIRVLEKITKTRFWITPDKTVNMTDTYTNSMLVVSDGNKEIDKLNVDIDSTQLVSKILFRGSDILSTSTISDHYCGDGETTQWGLTFKYSQLRCYINSIEKIVGILNIHEEKDYCFLADFNYKVVRLSATEMVGTAQGGSSNTIIFEVSANASDDYYTGFSCNLDDGQTKKIIGYIGSTKTATIGGTWTTMPTSSNTYSMIPITTDLIQFKYFYYYPLVFDKQYNSIITTLSLLLGNDGIFETVITKSETINIKSREEAYSYCDSYIEEHGNVDIGASFVTYEKKYNVLGQYITINRPETGLNNQLFLCTGVTIQSEPNCNIKYVITLQTKLCNIETLLKDLLRKNSDSPVLLLNSSESIDDNINIIDSCISLLVSNTDFLLFNIGGFNQKTFG